MGLKRRIWGAAALHNENKDVGGIVLVMPTTQVSLVTLLWGSGVRVSTPQTLRPCTHPSCCPRIVQR